MKKVVMGILMSLLAGVFAFAQTKKDEAYYLAHPLEKINNTYIEKQCWNDNASCFAMMNDIVEYNGTEYVGVTCDGIPNKKRDANYGILIRKDSTQKILSGSDTISFKILGDGNKYVFSLCSYDFDKNIYDTWDYSIKTKKDQVVEVTVPLKKMRFNNSEQPKKMVKENLNFMMFTLVASPSTANKEFKFTVFDLKAN